MLVGESKQQNKAESVVRECLSNPMLDIDYRGATGSLIHITGGTDLTLQDAEEVATSLTYKTGSPRRCYLGCPGPARYGRQDPGPRHYDRRQERPRSSVPVFSPRSRRWMSSARTQKQSRCPKTQGCTTRPDQRWRRPRMGRMRNPRTTTNKKLFTVPGAFGGIPPRVPGIFR